MADDRLRGIVTRMVEAGESEQDIAAVIQRYQQTTPEPAQPEGKSVGGFFSNALTSTGRLLKDSATGAIGAAKFAKDVLAPSSPMDRIRRGEQVMDTIRNAPQIASAVGSAAKERYGSVDAIGNTLYNDPAGVLADLSVLATGGGAAAARAPRIAGQLRAAGAAVNPLRVLEPAAKGLEYGAAGANRLMLAPPAAMVRQQRAPLEIERTALLEGATTQRSATRKLRQAKADTDSAAAAATARGASTPSSSLTQFPKTLDELQDVTPNIRELDELAAFEKEAVASLPKTLTPDELLRKRRVQDRAVDKSYRAEEKGGYIRGVKDKGQKEIADNMRVQFRQVAPEAAASDDRARRLGTVRGALVAANARPKTPPMSGAIIGGGTGAFLGGPAGALSGAAAGIGRMFPQIPLTLSSPPVRAAAAAATPGSQQGLLLAALLERLIGGDQ